MQAMTNEATEADVRATFEWLRFEFAGEGRKRFRVSDFAWAVAFHFSPTVWFRCEKQFHFMEEESLPGCWISASKMHGPISADLGWIG